MLEELGPLFIFIAMVSLFIAVILIIHYAFMYFYDNDTNTKHKKVFTKKRSIIIHCFLLGYVLFYILGIYLTN